VCTHAFEFEFELIDRMLLLHVIYTSYCVLYLADRRPETRARQCMLFQLHISIIILSHCLKDQLLEFIFKACVRFVGAYGLSTDNADVHSMGHYIIILSRPWNVTGRDR